MIKTLLSILAESDKIIEDLDFARSRLLDVSDDLTAIDQMINDFTNQNQQL